MPIVFDEILQLNRQSKTIDTLNGKITIYPYNKEKITIYPYNKEKINSFLCNLADGESFGDPVVIDLTLVHICAI